MARGRPRKRSDTDAVWWRKAGTEGLSLLFKPVAPPEKIEEAEIEEAEAADSNANASSAGEADDDDDDIQIGAHGFNCVICGGHVAMRKNFVRHLSSKQCFGKQTSKLGELGTNLSHHL